MSLSGSDWLGEGFRLWKVWETPRDFMLPRPTADWSEPTASYAKASEVALYIRELFQKLGTPALKDGKFRLNRQNAACGRGFACFLHGAQLSQLAAFGRSGTGFQQAGSRLLRSLAHRRCGFSRVHSHFETDHSQASDSSVQSDHVWRRRGNTTRTKPLPK